MGPDDSLRDLRADLYRPGADGEALRRYEAARAAVPAPDLDEHVDAPSAEPDRRRPRPIALLGALVLLTVAVLCGVIARPAEPVPPLARGELSQPFSPVWSAWPPTADAQRAELTAALARPGRLRDLLHRNPELLPSVSRVVRSAGARAAQPLQIDSFSAAVEAPSELVVVWRCGPRSRPYRLQLSTLVQKDASIVLAPLAALRGSCSGSPQAARYRPILGMMPTAAELRAPDGSPLAVMLVE